MSKQTLNSLEQAIDNAQSYQEYKEACAEHDILSGARDWQQEEACDLYDYKLIRKRVNRIRAAKEKKDAASLMFILHEGIHGNLGNIANPELANHSKLGTKDLIEEFLSEVVGAMEFIYQADETEVDFYDKLAFFEETSHAFGQSCLMLSGGAGLGFFHAGVIKALTEQNLLPNVVSGASAGSIMAALIGTRTDEELIDILTPESIYEKFHRWGVWKGVFEESLLDSTNLENALIELFDLTTFEEAFNKTGRHITVTVSPADLHQYSRLLNARTSPNAIITQAVRASCAVPYMFSPVQLKAKNQAGEVVPYIPNRKFADGSVMADMPFNRLARLYGVNHSIVSQTNPLAVPFLSRTKKHSNGVFALTKRHFVKMLKTNSVYACDMVENMVTGKTAKMGIHKVRSIIDQQYVGDINILPARGFRNLAYVLSNPTQESITHLISTAERATWSQLELIERSTRISKTFDQYLRQLRVQEQERLHHEHELRLVSSR
ncbi:DUF3336 domain-containing protein [Thalassotalea sp. M1531]|uniref:DUF3336 domain-containing protein n=1 Tax=Thalassotalea algicola TaxID=2716224 RepID=A0A7Y0Q635_9GAMM|nr:DUF3336 domain-containing protein [Thalassotalea algicola]NMP30771.1 DUF3336 domain-containing protein [Thalassotalea algicola]